MYPLAFEHDRARHETALARHDERIESLEKGQDLQGQAINRVDTKVDNLVLLGIAQLAAALGGAIAILVTIKKG